MGPHQDEMFDGDRRARRMPEAGRALGRQRLPKLHDELRAHRPDGHKALGPPRRPIAAQLRDTAEDLRRGVDPSMIARRLEQISESIDPTITGRIA